MAQARHPSVLGYVLAGLLAVVGLAVGIGLVVQGVVRYADRIEGFDRVPLGSVDTVELGEGGYSLYYEAPGAEEDGAPFVPVVVTPSAGGEELALEPYDDEVTYDVSGYEGVGIWTFTVDQPGAYEIATTVDSIGFGELAIGRGIGRGVVRSVLFGVAVILGSLLSALLLTVLTIVRRSRAGRAGPPPPQWGPPPPPPQWGPQQQAQAHWGQPPR